MCPAGRPRGGRSREPRGLCPEPGRSGEPAGGWPGRDRYDVLAPLGELEGLRGADLYAKVVALDEERDDTFHVCFTSSPPGLDALLRELG